MAKKTTSRSNAEPKSDAAEATTAAKPRSRARARKPQQSENPVAMAEDRATNVADANSNPTPVSVLDHTPGLTRGADSKRMAAIDGSTSRSMASEPSEDDIRMRAYHRYLERGARHGLDFEDWVEAERELRESKVTG